MTGALLLALVPIALLIGLGVALRRAGFLAETFWPQAERLGYYVLLPSLFVHGLATAHLDGVPVLALAAVLVASTLSVALVLLALRPRLALDGAAFTSVFQGGIRFNNYVGVSAAVGLFGAQGVALAAVANAAIVPTVNVLCVLVFARFGSAGRLAPAAVVRQLALNPLVVASVVGIGFQATGLRLPLGVEPVLKALGQASKATSNSRTPSSGGTTCPVFRRARARSSGRAPSVSGPRPAGSANSLKGRRRSAACRAPSATSAMCAP